MRARKNFWDSNAGLYDCFMRKDKAVWLCVTAQKAVK